MWKVTEEVECERMNERKIFLRVVTISLLILTAAFILLFIYVDMKWWDLKATALNPMHTVIATAAMILIGMAVYVVRNKKR